MKLIKWLRKQYEKRLPYKIIDVTLDELLTYVGTGKYPILCERDEKRRIVEHLLTHPEAIDEEDTLTYRNDRMVIIWGHLIGGWPTAWCKDDEELSTWLRVVDPHAVNVDDLI